MTARRAFIIGFAVTTGWMIPSGIAIWLRPHSRHIAFGRLR